jgi:hypothetical protein
MAQYIPLDIYKYCIYPWLIEFYRYDMIERYNNRHMFCEQMKYVCEDIRANTPLYVLNILTQTRYNIQMPFTLPNCDPNHVRTDIRIPQSHIVSWYRRSLSTKKTHIYYDCLHTIR